MISPSPIEHHIEIARAFGSRTAPLDDVVHHSSLRRWRRRKAAALDRLPAKQLRPRAA
jgi:hypothetical protein